MVIKRVVIEKAIIITITIAITIVIARAIAVAIIIIIIILAPISSIIKVTILTIIVI